MVELTSVLELENIRMSLSQSHSTTPDTAGEASEALQLDASLNASWVMHDEADSVIVSEKLPCKEVKESGKPAARDVLNVCASLLKIPRIRCAPLCHCTPVCQHAPLNSDACVCVQHPQRCVCNTPEPD